jgi:hypothetical protein
MKHLLSLRAMKITFGVLSCVVGACTKPATEAKLPAVVSPPLVASSDTAIAAQSSNIASLLANGDYVGAIAAIEASSAPEVEKLSATGRLILDGLIDPAAKTKPSFSVDDGLSRLENAAKMGHEPSVSDLVGFFTVGLNYRGERVLFPPFPALASCWQAVQKSTKLASDCAVLRKSLGAPK